jgi:hypothetical protein
MDSQREKKVPKTKESIAAYNKEYFSRPDVIARAKVRNAQYRERRKAYKKTEQGKLAERRYITSDKAKLQLKAAALRRNYGLTIEQVEDMKSKQKGLCAICHTIPKHWHVDHCHNTGKVRGMLCGSCNMGLGLFHDDTQRLKDAAEYLNAV